MITGRGNSQKKWFVSPEPSPAPTATQEAVVVSSPTPEPDPTPVVITPEPPPSCKHAHLEYVPEGGGRHLVACADCGKWITHSDCSTKNGWQHNDSSHWYVCDLCGQTFESFLTTQL